MACRASSSALGSRAEHPMVSHDRMGLTGPCSSHTMKAFRRAGFFFSTRVAAFEDRHLATEPWKVGVLDPTQL